MLIAQTIFFLIGRYLAVAAFFADCSWWLTVDSLLVMIWVRGFRPRQKSSGD